MKTNLSKQSKDFLMNMLTVLKVKVPLEYEDTVMIFIQINTEEKLKQFKEWIRTKMNGASFQVTAAEVLHKTSELDRLTSK